MKLWEVVNGYCGDSYVKCFVVAETEERAMELAGDKFKEKCKQTNHTDDYYKDLDVYLMCDCGKEWASEISDY